MKLDEPKCKLCNDTGEIYTSIFPAGCFTEPCQCGAEVKTPDFAELFKDSKLFEKQNNKRKVIEEFSKKIIKEQVDCPQEFIDIVNEEFWNLI